MKNQLKGGEFKKKEKKRSGRKRRTQKKRQVWKKVQREDRKPLYGKDERGQERRGRKGRQRPRARQVLGKSGRWLFLLVLLGQNWLCVNAEAEGLQKRAEKMVRWQQQEVRLWAVEVPQRWTQRQGEDRTEMKEAKLLRCTLLNGSAWSAEVKCMRRCK